MSIKEKQRAVVGVIMTGHGTMDTAIQAMKLGFSAFIKKPFELAELVQVVEDSLHKAALMEENTRLKTLIPLYRLGEKFLTSRTIKEILNELIETVSIQTGAQRVSVMLFKEAESCLRIVAAKGISAEIVNKVRIKPGEKIAGHVFQKGKAVILNGGPEDNPGRDRREAGDVRGAQEGVGRPPFPFLSFIICQPTTAHMLDRRKRMKGRKTRKLNKFSIINLCYLVIIKLFMIC